MEVFFPGISFGFFWSFVSRFFYLGVLYKHQEQQKDQGTKQQSQRGENETVTKGGGRKGIPLNEGEVEVRKRREEL